MKPIEIRITSALRRKRNILGRFITNKKQNDHPRLKAIIQHLQKGKRYGRVQERTAMAKGVCSWAKDRRTNKEFS
jgi:hypothetical protein